MLSCLLLCFRDVLCLVGKLSAPPYEYEYEDATSRLIFISYDLQEILLWYSVLHKPVTRHMFLCVI